MDPQADTLYAPYGYVPTKMVTILFLALFSLSTVAHLGQAVFSRMWWLLPTVVLCGALEILGWAARFWSSTSPALFVPFQIQIIGTVLAPTPLFAANFIILGKLIEYLGPVYSRMGPRWYTIVFFTCDVISLVVQAVGGAMASLAAGNGSDPTPGGNVMLVGIVLQMATITIYILCAVEFCIRYIHRRPISGASMYLRSGFSPVRRSMDAPLRWMSVALVLHDLALHPRGIPDDRTVRWLDRKNFQNGGLLQCPRWCHGRASDVHAEFRSPRSAAGYYHEETMACGKESFGQ